MAHVAARSYANAVVKRELDEHLRRRHGTQPATTATHLLSSRPSSVGSAAHARYLSLGMAYNASLLGEQRGSTPASIAGPGCHGALRALAHSGRYPAVASAQLGLEATSRWPFADRPVAADRELWRGAQTYHRRFVPRACRLCRVRDSMEDIFHLACECPHPAMRAAQAAITAALPALVTAIWTRGLDAIEASNAAPPTLSAAQQRALDQLRGGARIVGDSTRELPTLVYHCLLGNMYPSEAALAASTPWRHLARCSTRLTSQRATCARSPRPGCRGASGRFVGWPPPGGPRAHPRPQAHHREKPGPAHTDTGHEREFEIPWEERERQSLPPTPT